MIKRKNKTSTILPGFFLALLMFAGCEDSNTESARLDSSGQAGSMARFAVSGNNLYIVDNENLHLFDITDATDPSPAGTVGIGFGIETIFPYRNNLFIGSTTGMHIYDISTPANPTKLSVYRHVTACDPVVVQDDYAYVTIRDGVDCRFGSNLLDVVDISDLRTPRAVGSYDMYNPHGLGIDGTSLFVTEGDQGLKIFDAGDPFNLVLKRQIEDFHGYDVIPDNGNLILIGNDGLYQYAYDGPGNMAFLSKITVQ